MAETSIPRRVRISGDGSTLRTKITDAATGEPIGLVQSYTITQRVGQLASAVIEVLRPHVDMEVDAEIRPALPAVPACQGANCGTTDGVSHSPECVAEAAKAQGWTQTKLTPDDIQAAITSEHYFTAAEAGRDVTSEMVDRFLGWKLPADFSPDCGISFKRESDYEHPEFGRSKFEPVGTNLLTAAQAKAMLEHILQPQPEHESLRQLTFCVLILRNGAKVVGINYGSIDPAGHSAEMGRTEARKDAINKVWELEGYALRERLKGSA